MTEFNNTIMRPPRPGKPHIALINGYWRVSKMPKPYSYRDGLPWQYAHNFIGRLNK